jgi:DNA end-binding protein Ku
MPRATWKGFLRLSLVSCPIYLTPATTRTRSIRLNQVWVPRAPRPEPRFAEAGYDEDVAAPPPARAFAPGPERSTSPDIAGGLEPPDLTGPAERIALQPVSRETGESVERSEVMKGYEYERGQFVTFTADELKALDVESTRTVDLTTFVPRVEVDPIYFNAPYYVYPDGKLAAEAFGVIGAAMARSGIAGLGRITLSRRERMAYVEPRGAGMVLITLRAAEEVRAAELDNPSAEVDEDMVAVAETIIQRRAGHFDPTQFRDRYQDALRELIEAKIKGRRIAAKTLAEPAPVYDLMAALKRSVQHDDKPERKPRSRRSSDRRQRNLLLPVRGDGSARKLGVPVPRPRRRKKVS